MHVVTPISPDALRTIFEANGWSCVGETNYFYAMQRNGAKDEPFFIPRIGSLVPVETMDSATHSIGLQKIIAGMTSDVLDDVQRRMAASTDD